jgi:hypothetical protein
MNCNHQCPLGIALLAIPFSRLADSAFQQSMSAQLPWWLWLVIILLALVAISWWQFYLRPMQVQDVQDLEGRLDHGHENHSHSDSHSHSQPANAAIKSNDVKTSPEKPIDPHDTAGISEASPGNPLDSDH